MGTGVLPEEGDGAGARMRAARVLISWVSRSAQSEENVNVERLHAIARAIQNDLETTNVVVTMAELSSAVANAAAEPQEPQYEQQLSAALEQLGKV